MLEGWQDGAYLILFDEAEVSGLTADYELEKYLAGYRIVGLEGWDDFIVKGPDKQLATVPTVPISAQHLAPRARPLDRARLESDVRIKGKLKWYVKPIVFGGDPAAQENITWVTLEQHIKLVKWWNECYRKSV